MHKLRQGRPAQPVFRVTGARPGLAEDVRSRQRRYAISMSIRTLCFVLAVIVPGWFRLGFILAAVVLPYLSVVFANAGREPVGALPAAFVDLRGRPELPGTPAPTDSDRRA